MLYPTFYGYHIDRILRSDEQTSVITTQRSLKVISKLLHATSICLSVQGEKTKVEIIKLLVLNVIFYKIEATTNDIDILTIE